MYKCTKRGLLCAGVWSGGARARVATATVPYVHVHVCMCMCICIWICMCICMCQGYGLVGLASVWQQLQCLASVNAGLSAILRYVLNPYMYSKPLHFEPKPSLDPRSETHNLKPETRNSKPETLNPKRRDVSEVTMKMLLR